MHDSRAALDIIIQSSTVELFHSWGIAVAPVARNLFRPEQFQSYELVASIDFDGRGLNGTLALAVPQSVFALVKQDPTRPHTGRDWVRENVNQLLGRIKGRLLQFQVTLKAGLPAVMTPEAFEQMRARGFLAVYAFRTLRGEVLVALSGQVDYSVFVYSGATTLPSEGDIILF
nr:MAG: chemotaxis protein CheX [Pseudomonadota bacterium]